MTAAHDQLPPPWKTLLDTAVGTHVHPLDGATTYHPVIAQIPEGRPALYLNQLSMTAIRSAAGETLPLTVDDLVTHATRGPLVHRHHWAHHDILIWDDQRVMHRATPLAPGTRRVMHRITLTRPTASPA